MGFFREIICTGVMRVISKFYASEFVGKLTGTADTAKTLDGLTSSYFSRKVSQADSLMQMGRWFGSRIGYELLPRIWLTSEEEEKLVSLGFTKTTFGSRILRTETVPLYILSIVNFLEK